MEHLPVLARLFPASPIPLDPTFPFWFVEEPITHARIELVADHPYHSIITRPHISIAVYDFLLSYIYHQQSLDDLLNVPPTSTTVLRRHCYPFPFSSSSSP